MAGITTVFLVRHGRHSLLGRVLAGRMPGINLDDAGLAEARMLARWLTRQMPVAGIYSSPQPRAMQTAAEIAKAAKGAVEIEADLDEINFGPWEGHSFDALADLPAWQDWNRSRATASTPAGDSMANTQSRMLGALSRWQAAHAGATVVAVSHADPIKAAVCGLLGLPLDAYDRFDIDPGSVSAVLLWPGGGKVHGLNQVPPHA